MIALALPASSANLGPGFDTAALALDLPLRLRARPAGRYSVQASGRDPAVAGQLRGHLLIDTYRRLLSEAGRPAPRLALELDNEIPIGKGCGSSAAARLAGVMLANHFGELGWSPRQCFQATAAAEGHPDNAAACCFGGLVVANAAGDHLRIEPPSWPLLLAVPDRPLATAAARAALPDAWPRADAVANLQALALLTAAFAQGRGDLLAAAMSDRLHQPYRAPLCPLLPALLPLAGRSGILGVALSGAGPTVLLVLESEDARAAAAAAVRERLQSNRLEAELIATDIAAAGAGSWPARYLSAE